MKAHETRKRRRQPNPFERLDLRIELSQEEILADLQYPARTSPRERAAAGAPSTTAGAPSRDRDSSRRCAATLRHGLAVAAGRSRRRRSPSR